jgi:hypothetical protein
MQRVVVYNEGLLGFLYDESQTAALQEIGALGDAGNRETALKSEALRRLAADGVVVIYELPEDNPLALEIGVGPPLTKQEMSSLPWLKPQQALLSLPSGRLRVDSFNSLPAPLYAQPPYPEEPLEPPGLVELPPGDYVLTLHRLDTDAAWRQRNLEVDGPNAIVTLTPLARAARPVEPAPLLCYEESADLRWPGRYTIEGQTFRGLAMFAGDQFLLNLDREAAQPLGLRAGMGLRIGVPVRGIEIQAFLSDDACTDGITPPRKATLRAMRVHTDLPASEKQRFPRNTAVGEWVRAAEWYGALGVRLPEDSRNREFLRFFRLGTATRVRGEHESVWLPAEVEMLPQPSLPASYLRRIAEV